MTVLLDTSGLYAAHDLQERDHVRASDALRTLVAAQEPLLVTDLVIAELHALSLHRSGPDRAVVLVERILASPRVELVATETGNLFDAIDFLRTRPDRRYSLADAVSFGLMRTRRVATAFTLDADFEAEGFQLVPRALRPRE